LILQPLIFLAFKLAVRLPKGWGLYPVGFYVRQSLAALKIDDLDSAMAFYRVAFAKDFGNEQVQVLREILNSEITFRIKVLQKRKRDVISDSERLDLQGGMDLLEKFIRLLDVAPSDPPE
jgi:hypothetical protein